MATIAYFCFPISGLRNSLGSVIFEGMTYHRTTPTPAGSALPRRRFLQVSSAAGTAAASVFFGAGPAAGQESPAASSISSARSPAPNPEGELPFRHGVASGDPLTDTVILWTRVTPAMEAVPGSGLGPEVTVDWTVSRDPELQDVIRSGQAIATAARDHTVHVDPWGLAPDTEYFFGFTVTDGPHAGARSPIGRTRTAPVPGAQVAELTLAVGSCANWESGFFTAYADIARRGRAGELDLMVFLGDYIYEYGQGEYSGFGPFRLVEPAHETLTLADYRTRYGLYRTDPALRDAHGALPWVVVWDDHEIANNNWREGAENHDPAAEGPWEARRAAAMQAYFEWLPVRAVSPSAGGHLYRSFRYGDLVELTMLDLRTYRDEEASRFDFAAFIDPARRLLGTEQFQWLRGQIGTSTAVWNVLGSSVMFSPLNLVTLRQDERTRPVLEFLAEHQVGGSVRPAAQAGGMSFNPDQWDGYAAARQAVTELLVERGSNVLVLTGDIHSEWVHSLSHQGREFGCELVTSSISAPNVDELLGLPVDNPLSQLAESYLGAANPQLRHVDLDQHGYAVARIRREEVLLQFWRTPDVTSPTGQMNLARELLWRSGRGFGEGLNAEGE